jgi:hypothetical protein
MPPYILTRLMIRPHFQRREQEEASGNVMVTIKRFMKLHHVPTLKNKGLISSRKRA